MSDYYDKDYFLWQKNIGEFGGWAELIKFEEYITSEMNVIDFGCGGGFLLKNINCKGKLGIEINDLARETINAQGIRSVKYVKDAPDNWADVIISNHALEHVTDPFTQIILLKSKLTASGKIIFVVPSDTHKYKQKDINNHLYSWSAMNIGNLFTEAGFRVVESKEFIHRWPPMYHKIAKTFGKKTFNHLCKLYGYMRRAGGSQVRIVAEKIIQTVE